VGVSFVDPSLAESATESLFLVTSFLVVVVEWFKTRTIKRHVVTYNIHKDLSKI
jgi:hypothetical protein